jgi:hypothetical protein
MAKPSYDSASSNKYLPGESSANQKAIVQVRARGIVKYQKGKNQFHG